MKYSTILFDFDGTLANTESVAFGTVNELAPEFGFKPITREEIPVLRNMSAWQILKDRSGIPLWNLLKIRRLEQRIRGGFMERAGEIHLFTGVPKMIQDLRTAGYEVGIVSSNDPEIIQAVFERSGVEVDFIHAGSKFFGKARAIKKALKVQHVDRAAVLYVGDEIRDVEACKKAGIGMLAVGWGFNTPEALRATGVEVVTGPEELLHSLPIA